MSGNVVLLTGESGFLGRGVHASLDADAGVSVRVLGARLAELSGKLDLGVDIVIHLAAWTQKHRGAASVEELIDANVVGLQRLLEHLDPPPRRFLFASTTDVYGVPGGQRPSERSSLNPATAYAASKVLGERIVIEDAGTRGYEACVMRLGHIYGPGEESYEKFVPTAIRTLMKGRPPTVVGDGQAMCDLLYVDDAAEIIRRLALSPRILPEILNVAGSHMHALKDVAQTLIDIVGFMRGIRYLADRPAITSMGFDTTLLRETVGDVDEVSLVDGLRREVQYYVSLQQGPKVARSHV